MLSLTHLFYSPRLEPDPKPPGDFDLVGAFSGFRLRVECQVVLKITDPDYLVAGILKCLLHRRVIDRFEQPRKLATILGSASCDPAIVK